MLSEFLDPKSIAIIGASTKPRRIGYELLKNLIDGGFKGNIYPVNPHAKAILKLKAYSTILDIDNPIDLAIIITPAPTVPEIIEECGQRNVKAAMIISAGFSEAGNLELEGKVVEVAKQYGVRVVGPNCAGIINTQKKLYATFESRVGEGNIAFLTQSGALGGAVLAWAIKEGMGFSKFVSYGNACDIDESDILAYLATDPYTKVIALYIEGVKNGRKFLKTAREVSRNKPIIALKGGVSKAGMRAVQSHTGAIAGNEAIYKAVFEQTGIIEATDIEEMFNIAKALAYQRSAAGDKIAVLTNSGGPAVMAIDEIERLGLKAPEPTRVIKRQLDFLPPFCNKGNPVDITAEGTPDMYAKILKALFSEDYYDAALIICVPPIFLDSTEVAKAIIEAVKEVNRPIVACWMAGHLVDNAIPILEKNKIPNYPTPKKAAKALWALVKRHQFENRMRRLVTILHK